MLNVEKFGLHFSNFHIFQSVCLAFLKNFFMHFQNLVESPAFTMSSCFNHFILDSSIYFAMPLRFTFTLEILVPFAGQPPSLPTPKGNHGEMIVKWEVPVLTFYQSAGNRSSCDLCCVVSAVSWHAVNELHSQVGRLLEYAPMVGKLPLVLTQHTAENLWWSMFLDQWAGGLQTLWPSLKDDS